MNSRACTRHQVISIGARIYGSNPYDRSIVGCQCHKDGTLWQQNREGSGISNNKLHILDARPESEFAPLLAAVPVTAKASVQNGVIVAFEQGHVSKVPCTALSILSIVCSRP